MGMSMKFAARGTTGTISVKNRISTRSAIDPRTRSRPQSLSGRCRHGRRFVRDRQASVFQRPVDSFGYLDHVESDSCGGTWLAAVTDCGAKVVELELQRLGYLHTRRDDVAGAVRE